MQQPDSLTALITAFCRFARAEGLSAGVKESVTALEATRAVGMSGSAAAAC